MPGPSRHDPTRVVAALVALVAVAAAGCAQPPPSLVAPHGESLAAGPLPTVAVARVVDGDTLLLADGQRVRQLGIDACEESAPRGAAATAATEQFLAGEAVSLGVEPGAPDRDRFGRLLRYVSVPGRGDLGEFLVGFPHTGVYQGRGDASPAYRARLVARDDGRDCG